MRSLTPEKLLEWYDMLLESLLTTLGEPDAMDEQLRMMSDKYLIKDYHNGLVDRMAYWGSTEYGSFSVSASLEDQVIIITKALKD